MVYLDVAEALPNYSKMSGWWVVGTFLCVEVLESYWESHLNISSPPLDLQRPDSLGWNAAYVVALAAKIMALSDLYTEKWCVGRWIGWTFLGLVRIAGWPWFWAILCSTTWGGALLLLIRWLLVGQEVIGRLAQHFRCDFYWGLVRWLQEVNYKCYK